MKRDLLQGEPKRLPPHGGIMNLSASVSFPAIPVVLLQREGFGCVLGGLRLGASLVSPLQDRV